MEMNQVIVGAILCKDPVHKAVKETTVANLSVAINHTFKVKGKTELQQKTVFMEVVAWGKLSNDCANMLQKGSKILVLGKLEQQTWPDKTTGKEMSKIVIKADRIIPTDGLGNQSEPSSEG